MLRRPLKSPAAIQTSPVSYKRPRVHDAPISSPAQSTLERLLTEHKHCRLSHDHGPHIMTNPHQVQWHLDRRLKADPELLKQFLHDLSTLFEDDSAFRKALQPYAISEDEESSLAASHTTDSLVKVFLRVPCLQEHVSDAILQKLVEFSAEQDSSSLYTDVPRLILYQLRFLDSLYNESRLCEKILELFNACNLQLQKEIVSALPDILSDASHSRIVEALQSKLQEDSDLTVNVLDTLSNLDLQGEMMESVRKIASVALDTASISDLPVVIRFIMQSSTKTDADKTVEDTLRKLQNVGKPDNISSKASADDFLLVLEQFRIGISYHKHIASAMAKCLQRTQISDLSCVVFWTTLMLNDQSAYSNRVVKIVRKWASADEQGALPLLFEKFITNHSQALNLVAKSILSLAEETTRSSDAREQNIGASLYRSAFLRFASRIDVLSCLATHIGSGRNHEIDRALQILLQLCTQCSKETSPYFAYLLGLLDYCHNLNNFQLRTLFEALANCHSCTEGNVLKSDVINYITKNLQHSSLSFQRPAIIGALCLINANEQEFCDDHPVYPLFADLDRYTSKSHAATAFLCEEILYYLNRGGINQEIAGGLIKRIIELFQSTFLTLPENQPAEANTELIEVATLFNLNPKENPSILAIYPGLADPARRPAFVMLPTLLELLNRWSLCDPETVPDEDELSSIPLTLFKFDCLQDFDTSLLTLTFSALLHAINWFRALLNAFAFSSDDVLRWKCSKRLSQLLELQNELCLFPADFVSKVVPYAITQSQRCALSSQKDIKGKKLSEEVVLYRIEPLLRRLAPIVFTLLTMELKLELSSNESNEGDAVIYLDTFQYLLTELHDTLKRNFPKSSPFKSPNEAPSRAVMVEHFDIFEFLAALNYDSNSRNCQLRVFRALGKSLLLLTSHESAECEHGRAISRNVDLILQLMEFIFNCSALQTAQGHSVLSMIIVDFVQSDSVDMKRIGFPTCLSVLGHFLLDLLPLPRSSIHTQTKICSIVNDLRKRGPIQNSGALTSKLSDCALKLLSEFWQDDYPLDSSVGALISYHIRNSPKPLEIVKQLISSDFPEFLERSRGSEDTEDDVAPTFAKTLASKTWPFFFKACAEQISSSMNDVERDISSLFKKLEDCAKLFFSLMEFLKRSQKAAILGSALRIGHIFIDRILTHIPLMRSSFNENKQEIVPLLQTVSKTTRILQRICSHVKREKISNLTGLVPALKKAMDKFMYLVKDMFHHHDILYSADFKCGALKNRTIEGREIEQDEEEEEDQDERGEPEPEDEDAVEETQEEPNSTEQEDCDPSDSPSEFHC